MDFNCKRIRNLTGESILYNGVHCPVYQQMQKYTNKNGEINIIPCKYIYVGWKKVFVKKLLPKNKDTVSITDKKREKLEMRMAKLQEKLNQLI
jgi:hypothetical protein